MFPVLRDLLLTEKYFKAFFFFSFFLEGSVVKFYISDLYCPCHREI